MSKTVRDESVRKERIPVASNRAPLVYRGLDNENFYHRWVKDKDDRLGMFLEAGYEFVQGNKKPVGDPTADDPSKRLDTRVSKSSDGTKLFLMYLPIKFYNEDQLAKQKIVDEIEDTMRQPKTKDGEKAADYGSIKLERSNKSN